MPAREHLIQHALNADNRLTPLLPAITATLATAEARLHHLIDLPAIDVVLQSSVQVIPSLGHGGYCPGASVIHLGFDPENPARAHNLGPPLCRTIAHEVHHAMRWAGPGYGTTLGEALVTEGLALLFEHQAFNGPPAPWEHLPDALVEPVLTSARAEWDNSRYDHAAWFFGHGATFPGAGHGYGLASRIARRWQAASAAHDAARHAHIPASDLKPFLA